MVVHVHVVRVKSTNCTGFFFKKTVHLMNSEIMEPLFTEQWRQCSVVLFHDLQNLNHSCKIGGCYQHKLLFFLNQRVICVAAGEPHPQPHYQTDITPWSSPIKWNNGGGHLLSFFWCIFLPIVWAMAVTRKDWKHCQIRTKLSICVHTSSVKWKVANWDSLDFMPNVLKRKW